VELRRLQIRRLQERVELRRLQIRSSEEDSSRGSSKDRPVLPLGKTPHDINPVIVLPSAKIWSEVTEGHEAKTNRLTVSCEVTQFSSVFFCINVVM